MREKFISQGDRTQLHRRKMDREEGGRGLSHISQGVKRHQPNTSQFPT